MSTRPAERRIAGLLLALVAATGLLTAPIGVAEVRAATPDLTIVTSARYDVQPAERRVRVTVDMVLTNHLKDTLTKRYYFDRAFLAVLPDTSGFRLTWSGNGTPRVRASKKTADYTILQLDLAQRIFSGKSATYQLRFDLVDAGGTATRDVRVGGALVSFPVWAFATDSTPGSSVKVVFPAGFQADVESGEIPPPTTDAAGNVIFETGKLPKPLSFFAYLVADRPGAYAERVETAEVGDVSVELTIKAWPDDEPWSERVGGLIDRALPELSEQIGLPWPREGGLVVQEAVTRSTGGYAGLFDPAAGTIQVAYYADDFVVLHEAAHAWLNGSLLADRWASEGFASYYAEQIADALGVEAEGDALGDELLKARIPLNAWGAIGREEALTEDYAYAATLKLAESIAEVAGPAGLREVWADADARIGAYQPPPPAGASAAVGGGGTAETVTDAPDWRGLLDLLDEHSTAADASARLDALWREWVARDTDLPLLDAREAARVRYQAIVTAAGEWQLPRPVRDALRAWRFPEATALLADAQAILAQRTEIERQAAVAGLTAPETLRMAFESPDGFASATLEATAELAAIDRYEVAAAARVAAPDPIQTLGLWGTTPEADLDRARALFATGDLTGSADAAGAAAATWTSAEEVGRGRALSIGALVIALVLGVLLLAAWLRGRRRRGNLRPAVAAGPDSYATLAATPDPVGPAVVGEPRDTGAPPV